MAHSPIRAIALALGLVLLAPATLAQSEAEDTVVATVNGEDIVVADVMAAYEQLPEQLRQVPFQQIYPQLLERVITVKLIAAEGRKAGMHEEPEVQAELRRYEDRVIERRYFSREIDERMSDEALQAAYDDYKSEREEQKEVHARHILVDSQDAAADIIAELQDGADFAELAEEHSTGPSSVKGGDLGFIGPGDTVGPFQQAAFELEAGEITQEPVQTDYGWHVIKVEEVRPAEVESFEAVEPQLRNQVTEEIVAQIVEDVRDGAEIERVDPPPVGEPQQQPMPAPAE